MPTNYEIVFFDLPTSLNPAPIPAPSPQLAGLPGYPDQPDRLSLAAVAYSPDPQIHGPGPYPAVLILHGAGGLWSHDLISNGPGLQFRNWAETICARGYLCLLPDSFNPRGISADFRNRRPHYDPATDDALCSPNYERPKDVIAALAYLGSREDVCRDRIGLLAFSHGAQTGLNSILDPSISLSPYTVGFIDCAATAEVDGQQVCTEEVTIDLEVLPPLRIPSSLPFPRICVFYYPGCEFFGYHGSQSTIGAGRYMPDRRTQVLLMHGTSDSLLDVDDPNATPLTGKLVPIKFVESSALHAAAEEIPNPFVHHLIFDQAGHSFDNQTIEDPANWNTIDEDADEKAKRLARDETLKWFSYHLNPPIPLLRRDPLESAQLQYVWPGESGLDYQVQHSAMLMSWQDLGPVREGEADVELAHAVDPSSPGRWFLRLQFGPQPPPATTPENLGFFRPYSDFDY